MENQLPNFPVQSQNYIAPNLAPIQMPGVPAPKALPKFNVNKKWVLTILIVFLLVALPTITYFLGKQAGAARSASLAQDMNSANITPGIPTTTSIPPTPTLAPISTDSGTLVATDTANWKTFTNTNGGYNFKYPNAWNAAINQVNTTNSLFGPNASPSSGLGGIEVYKNQTSVADFQKNLSATYVFKNNVQIDGTQENLYNVSGLFNAESVMFIRNNTLYNIYINYKSADDLNLFSQLLSTFQFTQ
jgi:hypothetical protein